MKRQYRKINYAMLVKVTGWLVMLESIFMLVPTFVGLYYHESDWRVFGLTTLLTALCGLMMSRVIPAQSKLAKREGCLLTASVWVVFSLFGMLPFIFCSHPYTVDQAFTEAMSGLTTTGASIIDDVEPLSHSIVIWRSMLQWIGGLGIILFTLAVLPMLNHSGGMQMFNAEVTGITHGKLQPRISQTAKSLWVVYISLTAACVLMLWAGPMDLFDSINHALSTIATGGFSSYNDGVEHYHSLYIKLVTTAFMLLGSINFAVIFYCARGRLSVLKQDSPLKYLFIFIAVFTALLLLSRLLSHSTGALGETLVDTLFMVVSALSSTSYTVSGIEHWGSLAMGVIMLMMFVGGCAGSTSGGVKIDRVIVLLQYVRNEVWRALQPNNVATVKIGPRALKYELVDKVIAFLLLDIIIIIASGLLLCVMGLTFSEGLYTSLSAISNSGTCIGSGAFSGSLAMIPAAGKVMLSFVMLTGRLEIYTVLVLFTSDFWHK